MKNLFIAMIALASPPALADGFVCANQQEQLSVRVFNHNHPSMGTRNTAVMILSDLSVSEGNRLIARFTKANGLFSAAGSVFTSKVDHRYNDSGRKGERLAGTRIGNVARVSLDVDFSYARPLSDGAVVRGGFTIVRRNGPKIQIPMSCRRYLKG
jgi:hypothetical protein